MKVLFRVLVIVTVAILIGGLMYVGVNASGSAANFSEVDGGRERPQFTEGTAPRPGGEGFRPEGDGDREGSFGGFPGGIFKAIVLMTVAGGIYSGIIWAGKKAKRALALQ